MKLDRIHIKNFRSIKDETIEFDHNCKILIGKNEAGKSNVLKAIASVFGEYPISNKDKRKRIDNEVIDEYFVRAIFKVHYNELRIVEYKLKESIANLQLLKFKNKKALSHFINLNFKELLIQINIKDGTKPYLTHWKINKSHWQPVNELFIKENELALEKDVGFEEFDLEKKVFSLIKEQYEEQSIKCNYWRYKDDFLLPSTVSITKFITNPSSEKALENIFILCKRGEIAREFKEALDEDGDYSNLLEQVSKATTKLFHSIWHDFKQTSLALIPNGKEEILIKVVNKTKYSFEDRSDGFKKFISILLMLSTQSRSNILDGSNLIIVDEPDQSLYPTSARYLKEELLKIAEKSQVIYSTHSQYMIDSSFIDRHLIVEKIDDITLLKKPDSGAPFSDDELLRNAIGSSIFECLQSINIVFEGWLDKQLFDKYCEFNRNKFFDGYGKVYLRGISGVETLIQLLILANKKFLIIADSDKPSNDKRKEFERSYPQYKSSWFSYGEVANKVITMEDFLDQNYISSVITSCEVEEYNYDKTKNAIYNIEKATKLNKENKQRIKNRLVKDLTKSKIENGYNLFIDELKNRIDKL